MNTADIKLFSLLQKKNFTEEEAEDFVGLLNVREETSRTDLSKIFLTKEDKIDIIKQMNTDKIDLVNQMSSLKIDLTNRLDSQVKWLAGIIIAAMGIFAVYIKLTIH